jgi:hypothetical protein
VGVGFLVSLAVLPGGESPPPTQADEYIRGFKEGYESASRHTRDVIVARKLGEYFYDSVNQRTAFRWFVDEDRAVEVWPDDAPATSAASDEPPRRVTQLSSEGDARDKSLPPRRSG